MRLYLIRHGAAINRDDPACPAEDERYLTPEGIAKTRAAVAGLAALGIEPGVFLTSPLRRAVETAEVAARALRFPHDKIRKTEALKFESSPAALFRELTKLKAEEVICFGHAPHLDQVIAHALGTRAIVTALKKAGAACLEMTSLAPPRGTLVWLMTPKALRALTKGK